MSPYPAQTDRQKIIETARALIDHRGVDAFSLAQVASELDIKPPSLYRYISNKSAMLQAVIEQTYRNLFEAYSQALQTANADPVEKLLGLFHAHRTFAHANPNTYILAFTTTATELRTDPNFLEQQAIPLQELMAKVSGEEHSLAALRGALALVHGFVMLELKGQFQRGGDLSLAFDEVVKAYLRGWD